MFVSLYTRMRWGPPNSNAASFQVDFLGQHYRRPRQGLGWLTAIVSDALRRRLRVSEVRVGLLFLVPLVEKLDRPKDCEDLRIEDFPVRA